MPFDVQNPSREFVLQVKLTNRCGMSCDRCYNLRPGPDAAELETGAWRRIIRNFVSFSDKRGMKAHVHFIGGEPLLRPDLFELAELAGRAREGNVTLVTNGLEINTDIACRIRLAFHAATVSLPAGDFRTFEKVRGVDRFRDVISGTRTLVGMGATVALYAHIQRENAASVAGLIPLAGRLGARRVAYHRFVGCDRMEDWHVPHELLGTAVDAIRKAMAAHPGVEVATRDPVLALMLGFGKKPCIVGRSMLNIEPDGTVTPCRYMNEAIGDATKEGFADITSKKEFSDLGRFDRLKGRCAGCADRPSCVGCRALARHYGDALGEDPLCARAREAAK